jgi:hypothetical protein
MTEQVGGSESDPAKRRRRRKRKKRSLKRVLHHQRWLLGGLAAGLPVLAFLLYLAYKF